MSTSLATLSIAWCIHNTMYYSDTGRHQVQRLTENVYALEVV
jgi:hypothetical protein